MLMFKKSILSSFIPLSLIATLSSSCGQPTSTTSPTASGISSAEVQVKRAISSETLLNQQRSLQVGRQDYALDETAYNECSANWVKHMDTNHLNSKVYTGDTHAAYAVFAFKANKRDKYVFRIKGNTPKARFFSFETYKGPLMGIGDHIMDHHLLDSDPRLPAYESDQDHYNLIVHPPEDYYRWSVNRPGFKKLAFTRSTIVRSIKTIMMRIYAPQGQKKLTDADIPKIFAFDPVSGRPKACPASHNFKPFSIPQKAVTVLRGLKTTRELEFTPSPKWFSVLGLGANTAVKDYVINTTRIDSKDDVSLVKFRVPYSAKGNDMGQVRYWSFCFQNFARNKTLDCLPDYLAEKDQGKIITIVHGRQNAAVEEAAKKAGYYFIPDKRHEDPANADDIQRVVGFVYRNMKTTPAFDSIAYTGDYKPRGRICTTEEFLNPSLRSIACE